MEAQWQSPPLSSREDTTWMLTPYQPRAFSSGSGQRFEEGYYSANTEPTRVQTTRKCRERVGYVMGS